MSNVVERFSSQSVRQEFPVIVCISQKLKAKMYILIFYLKKTMHLVFMSSGIKPYLLSSSLKVVKSDLHVALWSRQAATFPFQCNAVYIMVVEIKYKNIW